MVLFLVQLRAFSEVRLPNFLLTLPFDPKRFVFFGRKFFPFQHRVNLVLS